MKKTKRNKINRIEYIVQENPEGVADLLQKEGYRTPRDIGSLIQMTKGWISKKGKPAVIQLLHVHPERDAILSSIGKQGFDNFGGCGCKSSFSGGCGCKSSFNGSCGCKSSFDGDCGCGCKSSYSGSDGKRQELLQLLEESKTSEILAHYEELKRLSKKYPEDQEIKFELEVTWDYLRHSFRKDQKKKSKKPIPEKSENSKKSKAILSLNVKDLAVGSFILGVALIVAQIKS